MHTTNPVKTTIELYSELQHLKPKMTAIYDKYRIEFGKYRGMYVKNLPRGYYDWLVMNVPKTEEMTENWHSKAAEAIVIFEKIHRLAPTRHLKTLISVNTADTTSMKNMKKTVKATDTDGIATTTQTKRPVYDVLTSLLMYAIREKNYNEIIKLRAALDGECERIAESMEANLDNLEWLNKVLEATGHPIEDTTNKAREVLKTKVHINIYDLEAGNYNKAFKNFNDFVNDMMVRRRFYNLNKAKESPLLKIFLRKI